MPTRVQYSCSSEYNSQPVTICARQSRKQAGHNQAAQIDHRVLELTSDRPWLNSVFGGKYSFVPSSNAYTVPFSGIKPVHISGSSLHRLLTLICNFLLLSQGFDQLRIEGLLCDVTLVAGDGDEAFPVHRAMMASSSDYFKAMFTGALLQSFKSSQRPEHLLISAVGILLIPIRQMYFLICDVLVVAMMHEFDCFIFFLLHSIFSS